MKKFFDILKRSAAGSEKRMDSLHLCNYHDQKLYPNLLANETVYDLNRKVCYVCSSKFIHQGSPVDCMKSK